jgi:hypothetical protein
VLELPAAHIAGIHIGAVHFAFVSKEVIILSGRIITLWKVASERAKGNIPVLGSMCLQVSGRGKGLLATLEDALDDARGLSLVFHQMCLKAPLFFYSLTTELALKLIGIEFRLILLEVESFVLGQMFFEICGRSERLLAQYLFALNDSWLFSLVSIHVAFKVS